MQMMSVKEYAEKMASSTSYIRQMCAEGILPSVKIGKSYKIDVARADAYFRQQIDDRLADAKRKQEVKRINESRKIHRQSGSSFKDRIKAMQERMAV